MVLFEEVVEHGRGRGGQSGNTSRDAGSGLAGKTIEVLGEPAESRAHGEGVEPEEAQRRDSRGRKARVGGDGRRLARPESCPGGGGADDDGQRGTGAATLL